ncbi:protein TraB [Escherichia coli]|nr:protein TraB [Escherichia coli]
MTGVVDTTFDDKVRQHATTEMQVTAAQMQKQYEEIRRELVSYTHLDVYKRQSQNSADASYLQQMALSFIALRLNVSPEIVDASHQALLQYIRPGAQNQMKVILAEEAKLIKKDNVNSAFFQTSVRVWPQYGRVEIRGIRKTWIGNSEPFIDIKHYILILKRENGVTWLDNFGETDDEKK